MHLRKLKLIKFTQWLELNAFQVLATTNEYEVLRWKSGHGVGLIYRNKFDGLNFNPHAQIAYEAFFSKGLAWPAPEKSARKKLNVLTRTLVERDGDLCFYCGKIMLIDDMTREHLLAVQSGGNNHIDNLVLAHRLCNQKAGHLPVINKVLLRDQLRGIK